MCKHLVRIFFFVLFLSILSTAVNSQIQGKETAELANIILPSPEAAQMQKYGDYKVNLSTGIPDINVPIYTIQTPRLTLPVSISYHASGFKPAEANGVIGFGWALNAGGKISRVVQADPDEERGFPEPFKTSSQVNLQNQIDRAYLRFLDLDETYSGDDAEYDIFYYNITSGSGKFVLKNLGNRKREPVTLPYRPLKIQSNLPWFNSGNLDYFEVIDEDGDTYIFAQYEETYPEKRSDRIFRSAWYLTKIVSQDKSDSIIINYTGALYDSRGSRNDNFVVEDMVESIGAGSNCASGITGPLSYICSMPPSSTYNTFINWSTKVSFYRLVKEIVFKNGKLTFDYGSSVCSPCSGNRLDKITLSDLSGKIEKSYKFFQSSFINNLPYYKLDKIEVSDNTSSKVYEYSFGYNGATTVVPPSSYLDNTGIDYWGFYNGKTSNSNLMPAWTVPNSTGQNLVAGSADREADETAMQTFMLNKITYPTGGSSSFVYEGNRIPSPSHEVVGGLRIKSITNSSPGLNAVVKTYKYGVGEGGYGNLQLNPYSLSNFIQYTKRLAYCATCEGGESLQPNFKSRITTVNSDFVDGSGLFETNPIFYTMVTEYVGDVFNNTGKTVFSYNEPVNGYYNSDLFHYLKVVEDWKGGNLIQKEIYKKEGAAYQTLEKEIFTYSNRTIETLPGLKVFSNIHGKSSRDVDLFGYAEPFGEQYNVYKYFDYSIILGNALLTKKETLRNEQGLTLNETEEYTYGDKHLQPLMIKTTSSKGEEIKIENKYPPDLTLSGVQEDARSKMVIANLINPLLENKVSKNSQQLTKKIINYKDFANSLLKQESIEIQNRNYPTEKRIEFIKYDTKGNLLEQQKANDVKEVYLWGYDSQYPVAKILNTTYDIAKTYITQSILDNPAGDITLRNHLNNLRTIPNTLVTTYTYKPLVGITSVTDPRGKTNYYEYDNFNRLTLIRDQDNNIIKKIDYKYQATTQQ